MVWRTCCDRCLASILADGINSSQCEVGQKGIEMAIMNVRDDPDHRRISVEASLLAMVVNDNVECLTPSSVLESSASKLAPTGGQVRLQKRQSPHKAGFGG